ncbi:MAG: tRNA pseudouridine(13) synthase TruD [Candidatus Hermodarchaeota archaeon]
MDAKEYDAYIGMDVFTTQSLGIGGRLKKTPEDFVVQEIGLDGSIAPLEPTTEEYPDQAGKFTVFYLVKRNLDSIQAIRQLSRVMGVSYKRFSYAGIKDRRAVTSQRVSFRGSPQDLIGREIAGVQILHPYRAKQPIVPGALQGNRFTTTICEVNLTAKEAQTRVENTQKEIQSAGGALNFYGPQRFGIIRPNTHLIGKQLILENYKEAIQILLEGGVEPTEVEDDSTQEVADSNEDMPYGLYERAITHYLNKHPDDYKGAFQVIPRDLARLYVHAFQSYIFNKTISQRVIQGISLQEPTIGDYTKPIAGEIHTVRPVTKDTISQITTAVRDSTHQIVIPIVGFDFERVSFEGSMGNIITAILEKEKITPAQFRLKDLPTLSSRGTFRPLLVNPVDYQFSILKTEETVVQICFDLPKGSYASVILREFIKPELPTQL